MSEKAVSRTGEGVAHGVFADTLSDLVTYRYVGCQSVVIDRHRAEGWTPMRSHLRGSGGVLGAPLAVGMLDTAGINIDRFYLLALTQIDLQLYEPALDVARLHTIGRVLREARTQVFTECRFEDADRPGRLIGCGAANWAVIHPTPDGFEYNDPGPGPGEGPEVPGIIEAYELTTGPGGELRLPALSPRVGTQVLHHGPMLVGTEQTALRAADDKDLALASWTMRVIKAGRIAPFDFGGEILSSTPDGVASRVQMTDGAGELVAVSHMVHRRVD